MEKQYVELLTYEIREMVLQIETLIGSEIAIRQRNKDDLLLNPDPSLVQCDCLMNDGITTVTIALPAAYVPNHILMHEIIHAHRRIVGEVPYIQAAVDGQNTARLAARIENDLEHLFVIPVEITYAPEAKDYWESKYDLYLAQLQQTIVVTTFDTKQKLSALRDPLLRTWLVASTVIPEWTGMEALSSILTSYHWLGDASNLVSEMNPISTTKTECISTLVHFLGLDRTHYSIAYLSVLQNKITRSPIPAYYQRSLL